MGQEIVGAFSEEQAERLTGLTRSQLRRWYKAGFIKPSFGNLEAGSRPFSRIYSFKDLLKLRVLNQLRNVHKVPLAELLRVESELEEMGDEKWTSQKLWVLKKAVVFNDPETNKKREIAGKQYIAEIPLEVVTASARADIKRLNVRGSDEIGRIEKKRHRHSSDPVFAGTRIPASAVLGFMDAGYKDKEILRQYPGLAKADLDAARKFASERAA